MRNSVPAGETDRIVIEYPYYLGTIDRTTNTYIPGITVEWPMRWKLRASKADFVLGFEPKPT